MHDLKVIEEMLQHYDSDLDGFFLPQLHQSISTIYYKPSIKSTLFVVGFHWKTILDFADPLFKFSEDTSEAFKRLRAFL